MSPLELVKLTALMERTSGNPEVKIGLVDGPVVAQHAELAGEHLREIPGKNGAMCTQANSTACIHGTFIAGILSGKRNSPPCNLPQLHTPHSPHFYRDDLRARTHAQRNPSGACRGNHRVHRRWRTSDQLESCPCTTFNKRGTGAGGSAQSSGQTRSDHNCGGGQSKHPWRFRHHPSPVGHPGREPVT